MSSMLIQRDCGLRHRWLEAAISVALSICGTSSVLAAYDDDLARQLVNPVAALISVPLQLNYDQKIGRDEQGRRYMLNVQPVVPFALSGDWNLISRTIVPLIDQKNGMRFLVAEVNRGSGTSSKASFSRHRCQQAAA